jgi:hypothetical protein
VRGGGNANARESLDKVRAIDLVVPPLKDEMQAHAVLAGLWLWHDFLDESHRIAQALEFAEGSYWHAIMHRREGDFSNSKYWWRRVGPHPTFAALAAQAQPVLNPLPSDKSLLKLTWEGWDPYAFVDLVEEVHNNPGDPRHRACVAIQQIEWRLLFDHCMREASGR